MTRAHDGIPAKALPANLANDALVGGRVHIRCVGESMATTTALEEFDFEVALRERTGFGLESEHVCARPRALKRRGRPSP